MALRPSLVSSGLTGLDAQLGGGIPKGSVHVLIGEPMNAYELLGFHFGSSSRSSVYVARDLTQEEVQNGYQRVSGAGGSLKIVATLKEIPKLEPDQRLVIEAFHEDLEEADWISVRSWIQGLKQECKETGSVALLMITSGLTSTQNEIRMKQICDGAMEFGFDRQAFALYPYLKVTKMRGIPDSSKFLLFKENPKGLFMENTRRVF